MVTEQEIDAATQAAYRPISVYIGLPYGASVADYCDSNGFVDLDALHRADAQADEQNRTIVRAIIRDALVAAEEWRNTNPITNHIERRRYGLPLEGDKWET